MDGDDLLSALNLGKDLEEAPSLEHALESVLLPRARSLVAADFVVFIEPTASEKLRIRASLGLECAPAPDVTACMDAARSALERHARGRAVEALPEAPRALAHVLAASDRVQGILVAARIGRSFASSEPLLLAGLAWQAALGLLRQANAPTRNSAIVEEKKRIETRRMTRERLASVRALAARYFIGEGPRYDALLEQIERFAPTDMAVLILGESGTGKELVARLIHERSNRVKGLLVPVNSSAVTVELFDSLFFGHRKGAFTGAVEDTPGFVRRSHRGSLFLDELGEMPLENQAKVLRMIQEKKVIPVGETAEIPVDFRLICATNRALEQCVVDKAFREDLFYRVNTLTIDLPPLRDRLAEIPVIVDFFLAQVPGRRWSIHADALAKLGDHKWPGNVRELQGVIQRALVYAKDGVIVPEDVKFRLLPRAPFLPETDDRPVTLEEVRAAIKQKGSIHKAAEFLGKDRRTIQRMIRRAEQEEDDATAEP